jgi:UDP-N-acetyl-D-glucosamine dehydrogenase
MTFKSLKKKINSKKINVGIVGLGYVGLPLAILLAKKGVNVYGFDINKKKIKMLQNQKSYIERINNFDIKILSKKSEVSHSFENISKCDVILICVPTPLKNNNQPDLSCIKKTFSLIKNFLCEDQILILESTSYPGTTREEFVNNLNKKFKLGNNFFIGFSSERINPGSNENSIHNVPKVVGGFSSNCSILVSAFYNLFFQKVVKAKSLEAAEFSKLLENIYRSVNIGFINEMKFIADKMGLDIFEIIRLAKTKPYGFIAYNPGPAIGGHCIPIDPHYLYWKAKKIGITSNFIKIASQTNSKVTNFIESKILKSLKEKNIKINKAKILILGMAYKKNIDDMRESGSVILLKKLLKKNIKNIYWADPHIKKIQFYNKTISNNKINITSKILPSFDIVILMTDHKNFNYSMIERYSKFIIDCRGKFSLSSKIIRA